MPRGRLGNGQTTGWPRAALVSVVGPTQPCQRLTVVGCKIRRRTLASDCPAASTPLGICLVPSPGRGRPANSPPLGVSLASRRTRAYSWVSLLGRTKRTLDAEVQEPHGLASANRRFTRRSSSSVVVHWHVKARVRVIARGFVFSTLAGRSVLVRRRLHRTTTTRSTTVAPQPLRLP